MTPQVYLAIAVAALITLLSGTTYYYHSKYEREVTDYALVAAKNDELVADVAADKAAIDKLRSDSNSRAAAAAAALADAQQKVVYYAKLAQGILIADPSNSKDLCTSADVLFNAYLQGAK